MSLVQLALKRSYTFIVMAILILLATPFALLNMATDIFPEINIPVVSIIWSYNGLSAQEMGQRIASSSERGLSTVVNDIEHIESTSLNGISIIKIFFQPKANIQSAISQVVASVQAQVRQLPPGITPPLVIKYSASSIPVIQLALSSPTLSESALFDATINSLRPQLVTIPGVAIPFPYGGKIKVVSVDINNRELQARGLAPSDVVNAISLQNLILPSGTVKLEGSEYAVSLNSSPTTIAGLNDLPVKTTNGATVLIKDVANVRDGFQPQTNIVRQDGSRGVLLSILKNGGASTLDIVDGIKKALPIAAESMPPDIKVSQLFDQSLFVKAAIKGVVFEAVIAAALTAAMVLLFLGSWRSTLIIAMTIPLSIFSSILVLYALGETLNLMTLGGLALSVGILVDQAIVTIENIERHLHMGKPLYDAIEVGAGEIGVPAFVATLCICIVFVPMFFLSGVAKFLFVPLAEAVVFAMLVSFFLSRSFVPTMVKLLMGQHDQAPLKEKSKPHVFENIYIKFDQKLEAFRLGYSEILSKVLLNRKAFGTAFLSFCIVSCGLFPFLGRDFFPAVDSGQVRLHFRAPTGTRIEETAKLADAIETKIKQLIPAEELETILDNLGVPNSGINLSYSNGGTFGSLDGELLIALKETHRPSSTLTTLLREELPKSFPGVEFFFQPADIVTQILNFGLPAAIDVQLTGNDLLGNAELAAEITKEIAKIPGAVDAHVHQKLNAPGIALEMDRSRVQQLGLNAQNVGQNVLIALSGSSQTSPAFWLNPKNGVVYSIVIQNPQYSFQSINDLLSIPVSSQVNPVESTQLLGNLVNSRPVKQLPIVSRYNISPAIDIYVNVQGTDLASVASKVSTIVEGMKSKLPKGSQVAIRGQVQTMQSSFIGLGVGLVMAIVLVYLLIVVNFQSWIDSAIIITALPAALAGIAWMLFLTGTTLSVPALTGAIMTMGVATANSILVVSFAKQQREEGLNPYQSALQAGATRIRPVLMTALAMIIGMIPMALGLGEGGEQNAPLGRAVIGGLFFATVSTLFFVPVVFAAVHQSLFDKEVKKANSSIKR